MTYISSGCNNEPFYKNLQWAEPSTRESTCFNRLLSERERVAFSSSPTLFLSGPLPETQITKKSYHFRTIEEKLHHAFDWVYDSDFGSYLGSMTITQVSDTRLEIRTESDCIIKYNDVEQFIERGKRIIFDFNEGAEVKDDRL